MSVDRITALLDASDRVGRRYEAARKGARGLTVDFAPPWIEDHRILSAMLERIDHELDRVTHLYNNPGKELS